MPGAHHQVDLVVAGVLGFERVVDGDGSVDVLLVPQAVHDHHRHGQRPGRQHPVHRLLAPEGVVARVLQELAPEPHLLEAMAAPQLSRRARPQVHVIVVEMVRPPRRVVAAGGFLLVDVGHHLLAEGAVVEPVVAHPAVDHRVHGHGHLERGMRIDERHQGQEAVVGDAEDADLAVALRDVLHQPVDGVVGVGGVVDRRGVLGAAQRAVHDVVALGPVLAAHVLHHADVAALHDHVGGVVVAGQDGPQVRAGRVLGERLGVVGGPGEQHGRAFGALRHQDHGQELHAVAHGDHDLAPHVIEAVDGGLELGRRLAGQGGIGGGGGRRGLRIRGAGRPPEPERRRQPGRATLDAGALHGAS